MDSVMTDPAGPVPAATGMLSESDARKKLERVIAINARVCKIMRLLVALATVLALLAKERGAASIRRFCVQM